MQSNNFEIPFFLNFALILNLSRLVTTLWSNRGVHFMNFFPSITEYDALFLNWHSFHHITVNLGYLSVNFVTNGGTLLLFKKKMKYRTSHYQVLNFITHIYAVINCNSLWITWDWSGRVGGSVMQDAGDE